MPATRLKADCGSINIHHNFRAWYAQDFSAGKRRAVDISLGPRCTKYLYTIATVLRVIKFGLELCGCCLWSDVILHCCVSRLSNKSATILAKQI